MDAPKTLQQAIVYFSDRDRAFQFAINFRWPNGVVSCPRCGSERHAFIKTRRIWECYGCKKQFSLKVGSIFEDSAITLDKWMMVVWMLCNCKNGVSSYEIARSIGVTQKSAWFMLHRVRKAMETNAYDGPLGGGGATVEVDESFVGGDPKNWHESKRAKHHKEVRSERVQEYQNRFTHKTSVIGMLDRDSRQVRAKVVPNVKRDTLQKEILSTITPGSRVHTDQAVAYNSLQKQYIHETVNHAVEYVRGNVHTNSLENFWSLMKRNLAGTYVAVEPFHLDRYLSEQVFRFNHRIGWNDLGRFHLAMSGVAGKRLTYKQLTGKDGTGSATSH
ncbi:Transposase [Granulicella pectinivorans]|uniref:Transposase n=1 Tax=Granulicella pectinivorans TaxID=474950 RepID=A0A1I6MZF1_9BACT|nr:IS1595 family transposase [Granulicella pectinivorans]SFS21066.1 Transposase [Granulicella pectinivorans]